MLQMKTGTPLQIGCLDRVESHPAANLVNPMVSRLPSDLTYFIELHAEYLPFPGPYSTVQDEIKKLIKVRLNEVFLNRSYSEQYL